MQALTPYFSIFNYIMSACLTEQVDANGEQQMCEEAVNAGGEEKLYQDELKVKQQVLPPPPISLKID